MIVHCNVTNLYVRTLEERRYWKYKYVPLKLALSFLFL